MPGMPLRKILCPIDFSPGARQALRVAVRLAGEADAELEIVHAWYVPPTAFGSEYPLPAGFIEQLIEDAQRGIDAAAKDAVSLGARHVSGRLLRGLPWTSIVDAAVGCDVVVIGTHGRTGLARILLGSVAEQVVRHAPCSVLAVRPDGETKPYVHALVPVDFSDSSRDAMALAASLVRPGGAGITLLHVLELPVAYSGEPGPPDLYHDLDKHSAELLDRWAGDLRGMTSVPVATRSRIGRPGSETLDVLDTDPSIDLVVMGSHGRTGIARALLGSVAEKVVRHARCHVLVARTAS